MTHEWTDGSGRLTLRLTEEQVNKGFHSGSCDDSIADLRSDLAIEAQLQALDKVHVYLYLAETGAWNDSELGNANTNLNRVLWLACADCVDGQGNYDLQEPA